MEMTRFKDLEQPVQSTALQAAITELESVDIKLDRQTIINLAEARLDVPVSIDDGFFDRFQLYTEEVLANAPAHAMGRFFLQNLAVEGIIETSRMNYLHNTYPAVSQTPIQRPLVMAGMPRSGSTFLLKLMSATPFITLKRWEAIRTFPTKAVLDGTEPDRRQEEATAIDEINSSFLPKFRVLHDVGADNSTEEIELLTRNIYGVLPSFFGDTPNYDTAFYTTDQTPCYQSLYKHLQAVQWVKKTKPGERWFLKSPQHLGALQDLKNTFPDAAVFFSHRDPASVFTSLVTLLGYSVRHVYSNISKEQLLNRARRMQHGFLRGLVENVDIFDKSTHIYFHELEADYNACIERVFAIADIPYDSQMQKKVAEQADRHKRGTRQGRVVYDLEADFGITRDQIREEFSYYMDKFPVQIEEAN